MAELHVVTEHVYGDHPQVPGAKVLIAAPGQAIPLEQAEGLGLVKPRRAKAESEPDKGEGDKGEIVTAENRRAPRGKASTKRARNTGQRGVTAPAHAPSPEGSQKPPPPPPAAPEPPAG